MKPLIYRPGARFGNEPVDFSRCRAVSISAGRQCGQRREAILYVDDGGILRRYMQRGRFTESLVVVGLMPYVIQRGTELLETAVWEVSPTETAWRIAPTER